MTARARRFGIIALVAALPILIAVVLLWNQRVAIAQGALEAELARRGVSARYRITGIGLRWERIENIVIGDARDPDLTADWAEIRLSAGLGGVRATAIRAGGVRLRARIKNGALKLGALDRLLPASSGQPFALPDLDLDLTDARARIDSPWGLIGARLDGRGNAADGFRGQLAAIMPRLSISGCAADRARAYVGIAIVNRSPRVTGPVRADALNCATMRIAAPAAAVDLGLAATLDRWSGATRLQADRATIAAARIDGLSGRASFSGSARDTLGDLRLTAVSGAWDAVRAADLSIEGRYRVSGGLQASGRARANHIVPDPAWRSQMAALADDAAATPIGPLLARLAASMPRTLSVEAELALNGGAATVSRLLAASPEGAVLRLSGGRGLTIGRSGFAADAGLSLAGGGLPDLEADLRTAGGETRGLVRVAPYAAGRARLALSPVSFAAGPGMPIRIATVATIDGPLGDGRIEGLRLPLTILAGAPGAVLVNPACASVAVRRIAVSGMTLDPASLALCPRGGAMLRLAGGRVAGGIAITAPRFAGRTGSTPLTLGASEAAIAIGEQRFTMARFGARLGGSDRVSRLAVGALSGQVVGGAVRGRFADAAGSIGNVPLLIDRGAGDWTFQGGALTVTGTADVTDAASPVRFRRLAGDDLKLRVADGRVTLTGLLREPESRTAIACLSIVHDLGPGTGRAQLDVSGIEFGKTLQPEQLTPLTIGVVANVQGRISGRGEIDWSPRGVTSTGTFATPGLDLAAAFGPVSGLKGEIRFTDLLALETAPDQRVTVDTINPGTPVKNGVIAYQLLAGQRLRVDSGRWPFAGGALLLEPTTLDLGRPSTRRLTFRVDGLDAARFVEELQFENLAATGRFDGVLPMAFDERGGRIEGGRLVARPGGGTIAYVGEVSNADMNMFAKLAFDALKSLRYNNLTIEMDGPLDGEMVSRVNFRGINQAPKGESRGLLARQFDNLPFIFNVTIRAPFRGLLNTARTFQDPRSLLGGVLPPVQPAESGRKR